MHADRGTLVYENEAIATIADPFGGTSTVVEAPFTGLLIGVAQNPLVYPGNPLCHIVSVDERTQRAIERNS